MSARRRSDRVLRRDPNGDLVDERRGKPVSLDELREDLRAGRRFRATRAGGGDCTYALLAELLTGRPPGADPYVRTGSGSLLGRLFGDALDRASFERPDQPGTARRERRRARDRSSRTPR